MFKKQFTIQSNHLLKSSDRRRLRTELKECFPLLGDEDWERILPHKVGEVIVLKLSNKATVYCFQCNTENEALEFSSGGGKWGQPLFVFVPEEGGWFPTVYTLWKVPHLLPCFETHSQVSRFLLGAADLMLPGVYPTDNDGSFTNVQFGQRRSVIVRGNPMPFAVGVCCCSSVDIKNKGLKGRALKLVHYYGDGIWSLGDRSKPNQGFTLEQIDSVDNLNEDNNNVQLITQQQSNVEEEEYIAQTTSQLSIEEDGSLEHSNEVDMDALLDRCFLQAAKCSIEDRQLPMEASKMFNEFILPARPAHTVIDWKKSSHKKLGAFMKSLSKRKLCKLKEGKGQLQVLTINRNHEMYQSFVPYYDDSSKEKQSNLEDDGSSHDDVVSHNGIPQVSEMWKPHQHMKHFLECLQKNENALYSREEIREALQQYVQHKWPQKKESSENGLMEDIPSTMDWKEVELMLLSRMQPYHVLYKPGEEPMIRKGAVKPIAIIVEDRQGGRKHVTRIQGIETFGIEPEDFAQKAQIAFACASSVHPLPGKQNHLVEVQCQGNVTSDVTKWLLQKFGIPSTWIQVQDKRKKK
ncbi:Eukaryotic translation initiation factor 2D [Galdieria sulphuraria]|nr:Eukaryotic translation initiation factor 2D [Galdieria sulphuraria]